jgi:hypothetical protein
MRASIKRRTREVGARTADEAHNRTRVGRRTSRASGSERRARSAVDEQRSQGQAAERPIGAMLTLHEHQQPREGVYTDGRWGARYKTDARLSRLDRSEVSGADVAPEAAQTCPRSLCARSQVDLSCTTWTEQTCRGFAGWRQGSWVWALANYTPGISRSPSCRHMVRVEPSRTAWGEHPELWAWGTHRTSKHSLCVGSA